MHLVIVEAVWTEIAVGLVDDAGCCITAVVQLGILMRNVAVLKLLAQMMMIRCSCVFSS